MLRLISRESSKAHEASVVADFALAFRYLQQARETNAACPSLYALTALTCEVGASCHHTATTSSISQEATSKHQPCPHWADPVTNYKQSTSTSDYSDGDIAYSALGYDVYALAHCNIARHFYFTDDLQSARAQFIMAINRNVNGFALPFVGLGLVHEAEGNTAEALKHYFVRTNFDRVQI